MENTGSLQLLAVSVGDVIKNKMLKFTFKCETDDFSDKYSIYKPLARLEFIYKDADDFEFHNNALAFKIAEMVREELEELKKERFLRENPELYMAGAITSSEPL